MKNGVIFYSFSFVTHVIAGIYRWYIRTTGTTARSTNSIAPLGIGVSAAIDFLFVARNSNTYMGPLGQSALWAKGPSKRP